VNESMTWEPNNVFLKRSFPQVYQYLLDHEANFQKEPIQVTSARNGMMNLSLVTSEKTVSFHSQYDPQHEAEQYIKKFEEELKNTDHVLFYGVGLGYHISEAMSRFPHLTFSIYDPYPVVFYHCLQQRTFYDLHLHKAKNIYLDNHVDYYTNHFASQLMDKVVFIVQPGYERIFSDDYKKFLEKFDFQLQEQRLSIGVNSSFQRLWIINSLANFSKVLKTPNILKQKGKFFSEKPVILVSAGPSLEEE
jgi:hypothetical protein